jgi:uncharacterized protein YegP (UPF0339 family)
MSFCIAEDNSGLFGWSLLAADGECLAESARFPSHEEAARAAHVARANAGSASIEDQVADVPPAYLAAGRETVETT